jgi:hypothetical protein
MKKKDLKKVSKILFDQLEVRRETIRKKKAQYATEEPMAERDEFTNWCEFNQEVSDRFKKLFYNILKYPDNLSIEFGEAPRHPYINVNTESIKSLKKASNINNNSGVQYPTTSKMAKIGEDDQLRIEVNMTGFTLNYGYRKVTRYKDENIYSELINDVKERVKEINANNFNDIWETISKESGLLRDSNLEDIFSEIKD